MSVNNIYFILHKPQLSENIGACARGMKNFNFHKLVVVDPKPIFPNDKILATSVGAKNIINKRVDPPASGVLRHCRAETNLWTLFTPGHCRLCVIA